MEHLEYFRQEVRNWLEENCPPSMRTPLVPEEEVWGGRNAEYVNPDFFPNILFTSSCKS